MVFKPAKTFSLAGVWNVSTGGNETYDMKIPGTLDESNLGRRETIDATILSRYTRKYKYEGPVRISRSLTYHETRGKRTFLEVERGRSLTLFIDNEKIEHFIAPSISTPHIFEVTGKLEGTHQITIVSDNSYPYMPAEAIRNSCAANEECQTNWNGLLGYVSLREETETFVERVQVQTKGDDVSVFVEISACEPGEAVLKFTSEALLKEYKVKVEVNAGYSGFMLGGLKLAENAERWDEYRNRMYELSVSIFGNEKIFEFGVRDISRTEDGHFSLNGRPLYLRGETSMGVFPETGYAPMSVGEWKKIFAGYIRYGVNFVRFFSYCPPEAAFTAADELGLLLMPEIPLSDPEDRLDDQTARDYYKREISEIIRNFGNHPSFALMGFGCASYTEPFAAFAKRLDPSRLYLHRDFRFDGQEKPDLPRIRESLGTFCMLPDFNEIDLFAGPLLPKNLEKMRADAENEGLLTYWTRMLSASGEHAALSYKTEIERTLKDSSYAGIALLGLQDYPGQGGVFYGMMNSHMQIKPYDFADPKRFGRSFSEFALLLDYEKSCWLSSETFEADVLAANYGKGPVGGSLTLTVAGKYYKKRIAFDYASFENGGVRKGPHISLDLRDYVEDPQEACTLSLLISLGRIENEYRISVYPDVIPVCPDTVYETSVFDYQTEKILEMGGTVFFTPPAAEQFLPGSVPLKFEADYQAGTMGQLIETASALFDEFPTDSHTGPQWEHMTEGTRAVVLPRRMRSLVTILDDASENRLLSELFEFRCRNGSVLFSCMGLKERMQYPEVRYFVQCIYEYLESYEFSPSETLKPEDFRKLTGG